jgi:heptose I phosphotransferase
MPWHCNQLEMPPELSKALGGGDVFERVMELQGQVFRDVPGRRTIRLNLAGHSCFVKLHFGVGWREIFKNLFSLRLPIVSALTEWRAIRRLTELGIPTTPAVAYGCRGTSPARWRSFVITEDLGDIISLEDFCRDWAKNPPPLHLKRQLISAVAHIAHTPHLPAGFASYGHTLDHLAKCVQEGYGCTVFFHAGYWADARRLLAFPMPLSGHEIARTIS